MCAVMLQAADENDNICELYCEGFTLPAVSEQHVLRFERWLAENLGIPREGARRIRVRWRSMGSCGRIWRGMDIRGGWRFRMRCGR